MFKIPNLLSLIPLSAVLIGCAYNGPISSHNFEQIEFAIEGRVLVSYGIDNTMEFKNGLMSATYFREDGLYFQCARKYGHPKIYTGAWEAKPHKLSGSAIDIYDISASNEKVGNARPYPFKYNPNTGVTTLWKKDTYNFEWYRFDYGHIQNTWPLASRKDCPNISIPPSLTVNEKQTSNSYLELLEQDLNAPLKNLLPD